MKLGTCEPGVGRVRHQVRSGRGLAVASLAADLRARRRRRGPGRSGSSERADRGRAGQGKDRRPSSTRIGAEMPPRRPITRTRRAAGLASQLRGARAVHHDRGTPADWPPTTALCWTGPPRSCSWRQPAATGLPAEIYGSLDQLRRLWRRSAGDPRRWRQRPAARRRSRAGPGDSGRPSERAGRNRGAA